ncbi:UDP-N-acetyl-D-glucosamine dehydrogenase [Tsuneonella deserti]|uniref:UDP-N-acetyl-D-glucosamine dehydrogenase n=1 Tax=Tsuneonella deserti TaxID=2035528 RepID=A0ABQ1S9W2_9SPHN|nr:nucleotide sugar dehydrogenase [Tsuneonella deserti]GGE03204.1 UDP-N-acetyl-D-glucosamine dehydrogenase [Tsuneonella deserti]
MRSKAAERLRNLIERKTATVGIIGLGYVGLPLAAACARAGYKTRGFDIDSAKIDELNAGRSYIDAVPSSELAALVEKGMFTSTADFAHLEECDIVIICVPTPLAPGHEPDLSYVEKSTAAIAKTLRAGQMVVLESTTYPGTTTEVIKPTLDAGGLSEGTDYFLGFSPEREDPGNHRFSTTTIPKIVSGESTISADLVSEFYSRVIKKVVRVSSTAVAEATKITENVFRAVNIALVNELKQVFDVMGIDVWEVIDAASTKPFGFMPFYPGPGLGGHCIPIDPFYLSWKARQHGFPTRFIELAGEINHSMPAYVASRLTEALDLHFALPVDQARIFVLGLAYKPNVSDTRESPALSLIQLLERRGARVDFHDPLIGTIPNTRDYPELAGRTSSPLEVGKLSSYDGVLIVTDHSSVNYDLVAKEAKMIVDTRNVMRGRLCTGILVKA